MQFTYETELTHQGNEYYAEVDINISNVVVVSPDPMCKDSLDDFYGYKEMKFEVTLVHCEDYEDGSVSFDIDNKKQIAELDLDYDKIEAWLWEQLEAMGDDNGY